MSEEHPQDKPASDAPPPLEVQDTQEPATESVPAENDTPKEPDHVSVKESPPVDKNQGDSEQVSAKLDFLFDEVADDAPTAEDGSMDYASTAPADDTTEQEEDSGAEEEEANEEEPVQDKSRSSLDRRKSSSGTRQSRGSGAPSAVSASIMKSEEDAAEPTEGAPVQRPMTAKVSSMRRKSVAIELGGFIKPITDEGDVFKMFSDEQDEEFTFDALDYEEGGEEEAGEEEGEVEEEQTIDRAMYYDMHALYEKKFYKEKITNNYLQRRMAEYFRRRKMLHVLKESLYESETQAKYEKKLDALDELIDITNRESERIGAEVSEMRKERNTKRDFLKSYFDSMQKREEEIGKDLMNTKGANFNLEKAVERLLKHQKNHLTSLVKMRLSYIKIRNKVTEKLGILKALDNLGENLHLIDYEQLKVDCRNNQDKVEQKDDELTRLRVKCNDAMQMLAHMRVKTAAINADIETENDRLEDATREHDDVRLQLLYQKQERDSYRATTNKLREDSGLLTKPLLLRDMEASIQEVKEASIRLDTVVNEHDILNEQVVNVRRNIAKVRRQKQAQGEEQNKDTTSLTSLSRSRSKVNI